MYSALAHSEEASARTQSSDMGETGRVRAGDKRGRRKRGQHHDGHGSDISAAPLRRMCLGVAIHAHKRLNGHGNRHGAMSYLEMMFHGGNMIKDSSPHVEHTAEMSYVSSAQRASKWTKRKWATRQGQAWKQRRWQRVNIGTICITGLGGGSNEVSLIQIV